MTACDVGAVTRPWEISKQVPLSYFSSGFNLVVRRSICVLRMLIHCSLSMQVAELVTSEFFEQGDRERFELKLTPSVSAFALSWAFKVSMCVNF